MSRFTLATLSAITALLQVPTFRSSVDVVPVYVLVTAPDGGIVTTLGRDDFVLEIDGRERDIVTFSSDEQPITGVLLLDVSGSIASQFLRVKAAASYFVDALRGPDRVRIGSFADEVGISPHLTADKRILHSVLADELWLGRGTALWRAVSAGMTSLATESGRRVVFVVSDGRDTGMFPAERQQAGASVQTRAITEAFVICSIEIHGRKIHSDLSNLTTATGGRQVQLRDDDDFRVALDEVLNELRHQYLLAFTPETADGKFHRLDVRVKRPGHRVRTPSQVFIRRR